MPRLLLNDQGRPLTRNSNSDKQNHTMKTKMPLSRIFLTLVGMLCFGTLAASFSPGQAAGAPQYFVAFPPGLKPSLATNILMGSLELVTKVPAGSTVTFLQAIEVKELASFTVSGAADELRLHDEVTARGMIEVRKYLLIASPGESHFEGQLQLPRLVDEIVARRVSGRNAMLILGGDPRVESIYPAERPWSLKTGLVPSDGTLRQSFPQYLWGVQGRNGLGGTTVHWLIDRPDWMVSSAHEERVKRFIPLSL